jgi:hypothetical protein
LVRAFLPGESLERLARLALLHGDLRKVSDAQDEALLFITYPDRLLLLTDVANLRDEVADKWFWKKWELKIRIEWKKDFLEIRDELRAVWREPASSGSELVLKGWLDWRPSQLHLAVYKYMGWTLPDVPFKCSIKDSKFVPDVFSLRAMLIQGILEHWEHFRFCANASCAAPHFVAKRRDQTICDAGDCKAEKQRQHALKWWRANRAKSPSKTKRRSERNVTRKTR